MTARLVWSGPPASLVRGLTTILVDLAGVSSARPFASPAMLQLLLGGTSHVAQSDSRPGPPLCGASDRACVPGTPSISDRSVIDMSLSPTSSVRSLRQSVTNDTRLVPFAATAFNPIGRADLRLAPAAGPPRPEKDQSR